MSTISCTIGGNSVIIANRSFSLADALENRSILTLTVLDSPGTANYTPGQPVVFTDSIQGITYSGYVNTSQPTKLGIAGPFVAHVVTCVDKQRLIDKRTNKNNYLNWYAGDIATNFIDTTLAAEGVTAAYATRRDTTANDFNKGIISGVVGTSNVGDGDLELVSAGTNVTITENTTAQFAVGTLLNVVATSNRLLPTTVSAINLTSNLVGAISNGYLYMKIWSGSMVVGTNDTLNYAIWITSASKQHAAGVDFDFSDGTRLKSVGMTDQNGISANPATDLTGYGVDQWYTRTITIPASITGKTITDVTIAFEGNTVGAYTAYFSNIYLGSQPSTPFFSTSALTTNVNPPIALYIAGYYLPQSSTKIVQVFNPSTVSRTSPAYSIDAVKLLKSSLIYWYADTPTASGVAISVSYDGGASYFPCTINAPLPGLPVGSNVAGGTITLKETFLASASDPTSLPYFSSVTVTLQSAPNATKSDIITTFATQAVWNTGTFTNTIALANGDLTIGTLTRNWSDLSLTGQTLFAQPVGVTNSAASGAYVMSLPAFTGGFQPYGESRLDFANIAADFTLDVDMKMNPNNATVGVGYRQTGWVNLDFDFAYMVWFQSNGIQIGYGSNANAGSGTYTVLKGYTTTISANTVYHLKLVVTGSTHLVYFNGGTTPVMIVNDSTYMSPGNFGFRGYNNDPSNTTSCTWDNLVITPNANGGTWQGPANSISSLTTCGLSTINWTEIGTSNTNVSSVLVQTSIDSGGTFQTCTNGGGIPGLPSGTNVSGKSVIVKATINSISQSSDPLLRQLVWRVLGQYPGSTGTRSTLPLAYDTATRTNVGSGFGVGTDGQTYTQIGTATTNLTSNKLQITNTTGDVHMLYGSRVAGDCEGTVRFTLSASSIVFGMELHYGDVNNYYRFYASTTTLTIQKRLAGTSTTLQTASMALATGTAYRMRFRIVGSGPVNLYGKVWASGILEPTSWNVTAIDS